MQLGSGVKCTFSETSNSARREAENFKCSYKYPQQPFQVRGRRNGTGKYKQTPPIPNTTIFLRTERINRDLWQRWEGWAQGWVSTTQYLKNKSIKNYPESNEWEFRSTQFQSIIKPFDNMTKPFLPFQKHSSPSYIIKQKIPLLCSTNRQGIHMAHGKTGLNPFGVLLPESALPSKSVICKGPSLEARLH